MQILGRIIIFHAPGHIIGHTAKRVNNIGNAVEIDDHILVGREAQHLFYLAFGGLNALFRAVGRIDFLGIP